MMEQLPDISTAVSLMRMALALLDKVGNTSVAVHLQQAIDVATNAPIPRNLEEAETLLDTAEARRLLGNMDRAQ